MTSETPQIDAAQALCTLLALCVKTGNAPQVIGAFTGPGRRYELMLIVEGTELPGAVLVVCTFVGNIDSQSWEEIREWWKRFALVLKAADAVFQGQQP